MGRDLTSTSLMLYLKYSFDIEEGLSKFISIKQYGSPYNLPDLAQHGSSYNLLNQWDPGDKPLFSRLSRKATAAKIIYFLWIQSETNLSCMLSKHWELLQILQVIQKIAYPLGSHPFDLKVSNLRKNKEKRLKKTHVIQINGLATSHTQEFHHLHKNIHIYVIHFIHAIHSSTRTCHIHHRRGVTEVCHFGHFWLSYGRCDMSRSPLGMLLGLSW